jgi:hypothetical protein
VLFWLTTTTTFNPLPPAKSSPAEKNKSANPIAKHKRMFTHLLSPENVFCKGRRVSLMKDDGTDGQRND